MNRRCVVFFLFSIIGSMWCMHSYTIDILFCDLPVIKKLKRMRKNIEDILFTRYFSQNLHSIENQEEIFLFSHAYNGDSDELNNLIKKSADTEKLKKQCYIKIDNITGQHSVFGIVLIAPEHAVPFKDKKRCVQRLKALGFRPTEGDTKLAFLEWWERVPFNKMLFLYHAAIKDETNFAVLPRELIQLIALAMAQSEESLV
jgi:hypothetical protein